MDQIFFTLAGVSGMLAVALGAFGAHILEARLPEALMRTYEKAVRYHLIHSLALAVAGVATILYPYSRFPLWAAWLFLGGILLFSGSLYARVFLNRKTAAIPAPFGGAAFILGWLALALAPWIK